MATLTLRSLLGLEVGIRLKAFLGQRTTRLLGKPQPGHCGVRIEEQEGNLTKMKHHADRDLPTTHDIPRPGKVLKLKKVAVSKGGKHESSRARLPRHGVEHGRGRRS
ncbi:unnamed protein product [Prunus brigantina]